MDLSAPLPSQTPTLPALALSAWQESKMTLHLYAQIIGKIRLALMPARNHWWHVPLYLYARGFTTRPMPYGARRVQISLDFIEHSCVIQVDDGAHSAFALGRRSVAQFYHALFAALAALGIEVHIQPQPYDLPNQAPFPHHHAPAPYDRTYIHRFWQILAWIEPVFWQFNGDFSGKTSPIHLFWHSLDLAVTRFSGRAAPLPASANRVNRAAYSHEVISFGFWAGDARIPEAAFYSYVYPEPPGLRAAPLAPATAYWGELNGGSLALYRYEDVRQSANPQQALLEFMHSAYRAGAERAQWPLEALHIPLEA